MVPEELRFLMMFGPFGWPGILENSKSAVDILKPGNDDASNEAVCV